MAMTLSSGGGGMSIQNSLLRERAASQDNDGSRGHIVSFVKAKMRRKLDDVKTPSCQDLPKYVDNGASSPLLAEKWTMPANSMGSVISVSPFSGKTCHELEEYFSISSKDPIEMKMLYRFLSQERTHSSGLGAEEACCFCGGGEYQVSVNVVKVRKISTIC